LHLHYYLDLYKWDIFLLDLNLSNLIFCLLLLITNFSLYKSYCFTIVYFYHDFNSYLLLFYQAILLHVLLYILQHLFQIFWFYFLLLRINFLIFGKLHAQLIINFHFSYFKQWIYEIRWEQNFINFTKMFFSSLILEFLTLIFYYSFQN
jgi:hypothetical protein